MNARRVELDVLYNGKRSLNKYLLSLTFTDNLDKTDDLSVTLADRDNLWSGEWFPESGDTLTAVIKVKDWNYQGDNRELNLGTFEVDQVNISDVVTINCVSAPITSTIRTQKKDKEWEKVRLKTICNDIASKAKLKLMYESKYNPYYERKDQDKESDLEFLEELCKEDGLCVKVSNGNLVIFDEFVYDQAKPKIKLIKDKSKIVGFPSFTRNAKNIYKTCEIGFYSTDKKVTYIGYFEDTNVKHVNNVLRFDENIKGSLDDTTLTRKAKARLREHNKKEWTADFSVVGDLVYFAGMNIEVAGFKKFDGKYNMESVTYNVANGFTVDISARKCLSY